MNFSSRLFPLLPLCALGAVAAACGAGDDDSGADASDADRSDSVDADDFTDGSDDAGTGSGGGLPGSCESGSVDCGAGGTQPLDCGDVVDACPMSTGLNHACQQRFALGINYAWKDFAADFGGLAAWNLPGVTANKAEYGADIASMKANGASVIRWWMFPEFRGDGVLFDDAGDASGLSDVAKSDIDAALDLAAENDVYLVFTVFSFDNFRPTANNSGVDVPGMTPMVQDAARRAKLVSNVVREAAKAAAASDNAVRLLGWDVINEPEWAVSPEGGSDQDFEPDDELAPVSLADMKALINESLAALREETPSAQLSVGWAAAKWAWAFSDVTNVDFHQPHIYGWVNEWWAYSETPASLGYGDKPTVMGEFYLESMPFSNTGDNSTMAMILESWFSNGYAGAWPWQHFDYGQNMGLIKTFADAKGCEVRFD